MPGVHAMSKRETVLLAEADAVLRERLAAALTAHGYHVISVQNGEEAILLLDRSAGEVDIVYADADLPRRSGLDVFLKAKSMRPGVRFVLGSGPVGERTCESLARIGVYAVLQKPFALEALLHCLKDGVGNARSFNKDATTAIAEEV